MAQQAALGEAKVSIRAEFTALKGDLDKAAVMIEKTFNQAGRTMRNTGAALTAGLTVPIAGLITKSTLAAARVQELSVVNKLLGEAAGYSARYVEEQTQAVIDQGIEADQANNTIAEFIKSNLDIADAAKISRIAQDAAVISGLNSTEVTQKLTEAIITGRTQLFKSAGVLLDLAKAYDDYGETIGKSGRQLSEQEKLQARVNATIEYGTRITGAYETAMEQGSKVLRSYPRYLNEIQVAIGEHFTPAFDIAVKAVADFLQFIRDSVKEGGAWSAVLKDWGEKATKLATSLEKLLTWIKELDPAVINAATSFAGMGAVMGPLLLAGGQALIWTGKMVGGVKTLSKTLNLSIGTMLKAAAPIAGFTSLVAAAAVGTTIWSADIRDNVRVAGLQGDKILRTSSTYEEYVRKVREANDANIKFTGTAWDVNDAMAQSMFNITQGSKDVDMLSESEFNYHKMATKLGDLINLRTEDFDSFRTALEEVAEAVDWNAVEAERFNAVLGGELGKSTEDYREKLQGLNTNLAETKTAIDALEDKKERQGGWLSADDTEELDGLITTFGELKEEINAVAEEHEEATSRIVFGILTQQIALMGLPWQETIALIGGVAEGWGLVDEATAGVWDATQELLTSYLDGKITVDEFAEAINNIKDKAVNLRISYSWGGDAGPAYGSGGGGTSRQAGANPTIHWEASGGPVSASQPYYVGERGIEVFKPSSAGAILSNHVLRNLASSDEDSGIGPELLMAINQLPSARDIARAVRDAMLMVN